MNRKTESLFDFSLVLLGGGFAAGLGAAVLFLRGAVIASGALFAMKWHGVLTDGGVVGFVREE